MGKVIGWILLVGVASVSGCTSESPDALVEPALLTRRDVEPLGKNCLLGGMAIRTGLDRNGDGVLGDDEVDHTEYLCNVPTTVLVRKDPLAPSLECPAGGVAVRTGIDDNGDGVLDDAEIDQTTYLCNSLELWDGDFTERDWNDPLKVAALRGARVVVGSLTIQTIAPAELPLLELVTGDLTVSPGMGAVTLDALLGVHGRLFVSGDCTLLAAPKLQHVDGPLQTWSDAHGALSLPGLQTIGGDVLLGGALGGLHLDQLTSIGGGLWFTAPIELVLPSLLTIGGQVESHSKVVTSVSLPRTMEIGGHIWLSGTTALAAVDLGSLGTVGPIFIDAPALTTLSLSTLSTVRADTDPDWFSGITIRGTALERIDLPSLSSVAGRIAAGGNLLRSVRMPLLTTATGLFLDSSTVLDTVVAPKLNRADSVYIEAPLQTLDLGALYLTNSLRLDGTLLADLSGLHSLARVGWLSLQRNSQLHDLNDLWALREVSVLEIKTNAALTSLRGLEGVLDIDQLVLYANPALTSIAGLHNVEKVRILLELSSNGALADLALPSLSSIGGNLQIVGMDAVTSLAGLDTLTSVGGEIFFAGNDGLSAAEIQAFLTRLGH